MRKKFKLLVVSIQPRQGEPVLTWALGFGIINILSDRRMTL